MKNTILLIPLLLLYACKPRSNSVEEKNTATNTKELHKKLIDSLLLTIDANPDPLHTDYTPSVHQLSELGIPALETVLPLLNSQKAHTRMNAQSVFEGVISRQFGFIPGQGYTIKGGEEKVKTIFNEIGYDWQDTTVDNRLKAIEHLKKWIINNKE